MARRFNEQSDGTFVDAGTGTRFNGRMMADGNVGDQIVRQDGAVEEIKEKRLSPEGFTIVRTVVNPK